MDINLGGFIASYYTFKNEIFDIVIRNEFDSTAGEDGYIEIWLRDRERYGIYKLFMLYPNDSKEILTRFIQEPLHGQLFTLAFINCVFSEVYDCLQESMDFRDLYWRWV